MAMRSLGDQRPWGQRTLHVIILRVELEEAVLRRRGQAREWAKGVGVWVSVGENVGTPYRR